MHPLDMATLTSVLAISSRRWPNHNTLELKWVTASFNLDLDEYKSKLLNIYFYVYYYFETVLRRREMIIMHPADLDNSRMKWNNWHFMVKRKQVSLYQSGCVTESDLHFQLTMTNKDSEYSICLLTHTHTRPRACTQEICIKSDLFLNII